MGQGMQLRQRLHEGIGTAVAVLCLLAAAPATSSEIHVYEESDGTRWITDHRLGGPQYRYIKSLGRPTARHSCRGMTPPRMAERARGFLPTVYDYADVYQVDALLVKAIITVESCFDTHAISRAGAKGLMQLMPQTAEEVGVYNVFNASENIRGGVFYFRKMLERFDQDVELALAAYNAGPTAVERYGGIPPFRETQSYVKRVLDHYGRYREDAGAQ
jgi:hypothetical protein